MENDFSSAFPIKDGLKKESALSIVKFNFVLVYSRKVHETILRLDMNVTPSDGDDVNLKCYGSN